MIKIGTRHFSTAVEYSGLVGKYVRMERYAEPGDPEFDAGTDVGMECLVAYVRDAVEEMDDCVEIMADYGMGFKIFPKQHDWRFTIFPNETVREQFFPYSE